MKQPSKSLNIYVVFANPELLLPALRLHQSKIKTVHGDIFSEPTQLDNAPSSGYFTLSAADRGRIWHAKVYYDYVVDALGADMQTDYNYLCYRCVKYYNHVTVV